MPTDDIGNYKIFDILNYTNGKKHNVNFKIQNDEILKFINGIELNKLIVNNDDDDLYMNLDYDANKLVNKNIKCSIDNKTNTNVYIEKYKNSKNIFDFFNKKIINNLAIGKNNLLVQYKNLLIVFNSYSNIQYYNKIILDSKISIEYYNDKYNFYNNKYKLLNCVKI